MKTWDTPIPSLPECRKPSTPLSNRAEILIRVLVELSNIFPGKVFLLQTSLSIRYPVNFLRWFSPCHADTTHFETMCLVNASRIISYYTLSIGQWHTVLEYNLPLQPLMIWDVTHTCQAMPRNGSKASAINWSSLPRFNSSSLLHILTPPQVSLCLLYLLLFLFLILPW